MSLSSSSSRKMTMLSSGSTPLLDYQSRTSSTGPTTTFSNGPLSKSHQVPSRPRPGRKLAIDQASTKRSEQNRTAQRNYRERERKAKEELLLERDNTVVQMRHLATENAALRNQLAESGKEVERAMTRIRDLESEIQHLRMTMGHSMSYAAQPKKITRSGMDMQYAVPSNDGIHCHTQPPIRMLPRRTLARRLQNPRIAQHGNAAPIPVDFTGMAFPVEEQPPAIGGCGYCKEGGNCPCVDSLVNHDPSLAAHMAG